ncbi:MAG: HAD family phosphatase [Candidatus Sericytochromatia bacterium]|nr:HAD family phosphatase [Candidatus Sericytochromatia bacterium]
MRFSAVLFDMDGVVCDNMPLHRAVWKEFATVRGLSLSDAEWRRLDGRRASDIIDTLFPEAPGQMRLELAEAREALYRQRLESAVLHPVPGIHAFLAWLSERGVRCVIATSATPENVEQVLGRLNLRTAFAGQVTSHDVRRGKPDPEVYLKAAAKAGFPASSCLVVEDAIQGVQAARAAGAACLGVSTSVAPDGLQEAGAAWVVPDFENLLSAGWPDGAALEALFVAHTLHRVDAGT